MSAAYLSGTVFYHDLCLVDGTLFVAHSRDDSGHCLGTIDSYNPRLRTDLDDYGLFELTDVVASPVTLPHNDEVDVIWEIHPDGWALGQRVDPAQGDLVLLVLYRYDGGGVWSEAASIAAPGTTWMQLEVIGGRVYILSYRPYKWALAYRGGVLVQVPQAGDPDLLQWPAEVQRLLTRASEERCDLLYDWAWDHIHYNQPSLARWQGNWWAAQALNGKVLVRSLATWSPPLATIPGKGESLGHAVGAIFATGPYLCVISSSEAWWPTIAVPAQIVLIGAGTVRRRDLATFAVSARPCGESTYIVGQQVADFMRNWIGLAGMPDASYFAQSLYVLAPKRLTAYRMILRWFAAKLSPAASLLRLRWSTNSGETTPSVGSMALRWAGDGAVSPTVSALTLRWQRHFTATLARARLRWTTGPRHNPAANLLRLAWSTNSGETTPTLDSLSLRWAGDGAVSPTVGACRLRWAFHNTWSALGGESEIKRCRLRWASAYTLGAAEEILWQTFDHADTCYNLRCVTQLGEAAEAGIVCLVRADAEDLSVDAWASYQVFHPNEWVTLKTPGRLLRIGVVKPTGDPKFDVVFEIPRENRD